MTNSVYGGAKTATFIGAVAAGRVLALPHAATYYYWRCYYVSILFLEGLCNLHKPFTIITTVPMPLLRR